MFSLRVERMRAPPFITSLTLLPITPFRFPPIYVDQPHRAAPANLLDRHPPMRARIRPIASNRTAETAFDPLFDLMLMFHA